MVFYGFTVKGSIFILFGWLKSKKPRGNVVLFELSGDQGRFVLNGGRFERTRDGHANTNNFITQQT